MRTDEAAKTTIATVEVQGKFAFQRDKYGRTIGHAMWMLRGIAEGYIQHGKAHRWLGYAQGLLVTHGEISLEDAKRLNKEAKI